MTHEVPSTTPEQSLNPELVRNFNEEILIKVTPEGERIWDEHYQDARVALKDPSAFKLERDEEGFTKMQLWEVANIFGSSMYNGNPRLPVEMIFQLTKKVS